jgi:ribosomal protein S18 acetylase RimI-like enzyme
VPEIGPLFRYHDRAGFDCGVPALNGFLKSTARQHGEKGISRTFVLTVQENPSIILGYFTLTLCEVKTEHLPALYAGKFPEHGLPAVRLARLAVDTRFRSCGYGGCLLAEAIHRTVLIAEHAGVIGLFVDAKNETACLFYQRYGFKPLPDNLLKLFLPIETLRKGTQGVPLT